MCSLPSLSSLPFCIAVLSSSALAQSFKSADKAALNSNREQYVDQVIDADGSGTLHVTELVPLGFG